MQDFIFNSNRQANRRRKTMLLRIILLAGVLAGGYWAYRHFEGSALLPGTQPTPSKSNTLPLPPIEQTRPVGKLALPPETAPRQPDATVADAIVPATRAPAPDTEALTSVQTPPNTTRAERKPALPTIHWHTHVIRKGETLAAIFQQLNLSSRLLHDICSVKDYGKKLSRIRPGQELRIATGSEGSLKELVLVKNPISSLHFKYDEKSNAFTASEINKPVEKRYRSVSGIIASSLFADAHKAGLDDALIMNLASIFGWDIDFALEIKDGDQFHVVYEEQYLDGKKLKNGPIMAAEFVNKGHSYKAIRYTDKLGDTAYYDEQGNAKRRAFIRTPVKFSRISSRFTLKRWHPVLKRWRSHKGVDYAAPRGTPVRATGNGKVAFKGKKGGYGNVIFLHHGDKYTTVYGHLSRFARGIKTGSKVKQGQIIAYVGSTGLATGPHLHYEFRVHGKHQNPLTIKLPKSIRLPRDELTRFKKLTQPLLAQLDELKAKSMVASAR